MSERSASSPRILLVEDDAADEEAMRRALRKAGFDDACVSSCATAKAALQSCAKAMPDCIVLDYGLPDINGLDFLTYLATAPRQLPTAVLILTGSGSESIAVEAMKLGAHDYLVKDAVSAENLRSAIDGSIARREVETGVRRRIENLSTFVNAVVHDLRGPLTGVGLNVDLLDLALEQGDLREARSAAAATQTSYRELLTLLESLYRLVTSEGDVFEQAFFNLALPVETACRCLVAQTEERGVAISVHALPDIVSDAPVVAEVVQNVLQNAIRHADEDNPRIEIRAAVDRRDPDALLAGVVIDDNGAGIDEHTRKSMFEPLWRTAVRTDKGTPYLNRGTGLGLAICTRLMDRLGGTISASNNSSGGARLWLLFPSARADALAAIPDLQERRHDD